MLDLLTADYSFVNERLARHYGIANVNGAAFRRVTLPAYRRGLLGQGSILTLTSVADRTSPVLRGKWVMEVLLGTPPPPPPPDVPALDESVTASAGGKHLSTRQRMEEHRKSPSCTSCHRVIDPLGLALDNFDVTGAWRIKDNEVPVDVVGDLYDGTRMDGPAGLRDGAAEALRHGAAQLHREPDDLRARPAPRVHRHAGGARHRQRRRAGGQPPVGVRPRRRQEPGVPHERPGDVRQERKGRGRAR